MPEPAASGQPITEPVLSTLRKVRQTPRAGENRDVPADSAWLDLAAESIAVKVRWMGVLLGVALVELRAIQGASGGNLLALRLLLALGALYALIDTSFSLRGKVLLQRSPLVISALESVFIGLLCHFDFGSGITSPFRYYYVLSLVSCAIRHDRRTTYLTWLLHCLSYSTVPFTEPTGWAVFGWEYAVTMVLLFWVTWASTALAELLKRARQDLQTLNARLRNSHELLEQRIAARTRELEEMQATLLHQEKMAAFGLLAAGIAHEVGNPLASISSLVQLLQRREQDNYTRDKLRLIDEQLRRIQKILRELVDFSRPARRQIERVQLNRVLDEALSIARYYKGGKQRNLVVELEDDLPSFTANRDQLVQLFLNLVLNAIDATERGGTVRVRAFRTAGGVEVCVEDDGPGVPKELQAKVFEPFFTTKRTGTGLGLFVCRKIVEQLGGTLRQHRSELGGAAFCVQLPAAEPGRAEAASQVGAAAAAE